MTLNGDDLHAAYYCAAEVMRARQRTGQPIPEWLRRHYQTLDHAIRASRPRHENHTGSEQSDMKLTAKEVAGMVDLSKRQVQRRATEFGGELVGGRWLFDAAAVREHLEGRDCA